MSVLKKSVRSNLCRLLIGLALVAPARRISAKDPENLIPMEKNPVQNESSEESKPPTATPTSKSSIVKRRPDQGCWETVYTSSESVCFLHTGFVFEAALMTSILSFNTITPVIAEVEYDIKFLDRTILPRGTKIIGNSGLVKTLDRVNVNFHTIVFPNGQEINFTGLALNTDGSGGVPGRVKKEKAAVPAKVLLNSAGAATTIVTGQPLAGQMISGIAEETGKELQEKQTYSISVKKGIPILVYVVNRIEF